MIHLIETLTSIDAYFHIWTVTRNSARFRLFFSSICVFGLLSFSIFILNMIHCILAFAQIHFPNPNSIWTQIWMFSHNASPFISICVSFSLFDLTIDEFNLQGWRFYDVAAWIVANVDDYWIFLLLTKNWEGIWLWWNEWFYELRRNLFDDGFFFSEFNFG